MYTIRIVIRSFGEHAEVLPEELEIAECVIEERISLLLLELLGTVIVDYIIVEYVPPQNKVIVICPIKNTVCQEKSHAPKRFQEITSAR